MGLVSEFKKFALRGNVIDLAVGIVIGAAFKDIVTALVDKIIMPVIGAITGGINYGERSVKLPVPGLDAADQPEIGYGALLQASINFLIIAFALFLVIKAVNKVEEQFADDSEPDPAPPPEDIKLLREIRDALVKE
ncbi:Large-conductance mechanosensitive channel [Posidoniimonas corsicana]|uniref:Large-conductance mechanosensitive channel n=1 Tax=Posidoniimonas corsicana TaxID=1938618 RepID=A0A5C5VID5_9BACT|nr:large-conductance mechanosensitive channel protein MscL [Posidoniimonas corsicana]TWT37525.1 Large-conductance mechanosensitive channel [Posidoniimonas corsicana]